MEVMNNDTFSQTETLVGQGGKTRSMGVSDDPMLMSMLSTGFYANPLRTMIQEVMFNAWDAHHMGGCTDRPIDIYINDTSGLIIRDYGPGIHDDDIVPVYGIYGASTKRKDKRQTGGFGLGCKSPFAYTESFTVTSCHNGMKGVYHISRVSDDAEGKPGITPLVMIPTEETGLTVTIPLESNDRHQTRKYIKDVLYLSGIKANIHFRENDPVLIEAQSLRSGEYALGDHNDAMDSRQLYAVYGGVRYEIPRKEEYAAEYDFMNMVSASSSLYIGFAPSTLNPLPNREGLNMSTKTKEAIRVGLELCMERFQEVFDPLVHTYFRHRFDDYATGGIQPQFAMFRALGAAHRGDTTFLRELVEQIKDMPPLNTDKNVWTIALNIMQHRMHMMMDIIGGKRWVAILVQHFLRVYPEAKAMGFGVLKAEPDTVLHKQYENTHTVEAFLSTFVQPTQLATLLKFEKQMQEEFSEVNGFVKPVLRVLTEGKFDKVVRNKSEGKSRRALSVAEVKLNKGKQLQQTKRSYDDPHRIWWASDTRIEVQKMFLDKVIIVAKTVTALNDTYYDVREHFSVTKDYNVNTFKSDSDGLIPAYVVHQRKGGYDRAVEILREMGYTVIEGAEPERRKYTAAGKPKTVVHQYRYVNPSCTNWQEGEIDVDVEDYDAEEDGVPLTEPTHYLYVKASDLSEDYWGRSAYKPNKALVYAVLKQYPNIAMVNNQAQADALKKKGVKEFHEIVIDWFKQMTTKVYRFRNMVRVMKVEERSAFDREMLHNHTLQAAMGIAKIKDDDSEFWEKLSLIHLISEETYHPLRETSKGMKTMIDQAWKDDPQRAKIRKAVDATSVFSDHTLQRKWKYDLSGDQREEYAKSLSRFLRGK